MNDSAAADPLIAASQALWPVLAAFAAHRHAEQGRGVVLVWDADLVRAAETARTESLALDLLPGLSYIPLEAVPPADDFAPLIRQYHPDRQVVLMVGSDSVDERLYVLEADGESRPRPAECARMFGLEIGQDGSVTDES